MDILILAQKVHFVNSLILSSSINWPAMKIPCISETKVKEWGEINARTSWTATENCYLTFTSVGNDADGHAYVDINGVHVGGLVHGSVATYWW